MNNLALKKVSQEENYRYLLEKNNVVFNANSRGKITHISSNIKQLIGYEAKEVIGHQFSRFIYPLDIPKVQEGLNHKGTVEFRVIHKDGEIRYARTTISPCNEEIIGIINDISELKRYALFDTLTGLYNRNYLQKTISHHRLRAVGVIVCDLDGLKLVNDAFGHDKGDAMLIATADILKNCFIGSGLMARIDGDGFAAVFYNASEKDIEKYCNELTDAINKYNCLHKDIPLSVSIGYAADTTADLEELFKLADNNMCREKLHRCKSGKSSVVQAMMKTLKEKDFITEEHAGRIQDNVIALARAILLPENKIPDLKLLAQFHDIGKVAISNSVLLKPISLTKKETDEMRRHSEIGYRIAMASPDLAPIADWILKHHEHWDGSGYPLGLKGKEIPLECRILSICDAFDAMTSDRPYKKARSTEEAIEELRRFSGSQFAPELVEKFLGVVL